ncbi:MAG: hypothetical protein QXT53_01270 [Ignisphaera sp.]
MLLVLTHDVDWSRKGPTIEHVLARLNRFSIEDRYKFFTLRENIYDGITAIMDYEQRQGIKSTFFFRTVYDDYTTAELYSDVISELRRNSWEVGLHSNSGENLEKIRQEKTLLEKIYSQEVKSLRVHYLKIDASLIQRLSAIGIKYDSSICKSKIGPSLDSSGCYILGDVVELPITMMDTYMFTYWGVKPDEAYQRIIETLENFNRQGIEIVTLLWHTNSVRMYGGKEYLRLVEEIWRIEWLTPVRVIDIPTLLCRKKS